MLRVIPRYPAKITARQVRESLENQDFEVTKRTIERDLQSLSQAFPLVCDDRDKPFGWSWQKNAPAFDLPGLSDSEALAVKLTEQYLTPLLPASVLSELSQHFKAATQRLNGLPRRPKTATWPAKVRSVPPTQPLIPPTIKPDVQRIIYEALLLDRQIEAVYVRRGDPKPVKYTLHPLAIVQRGAATYLVSTVFHYMDVRLFPLHRFQKVEMLDEPVQQLREFDLDKYIASGAFGFGDGKKIKLEALFTHDAAEHLYETPLSADQVLRPQNKDYTKLVATVPNTQQLMWWLLGFGASVEVLKPAALRREITEAARSMNRIYSKH